MQIHLLTTWLNRPLVGHHEETSLKSNEICMWHLYVPRILFLFMPLTLEGHLCSGVYSKAVSEPLIRRP